MLTFLTIDNIVIALKGLIQYNYHTYEILIYHFYNYSHFKPY